MCWQDPPEGVVVLERLAALKDGPSRASTRAAD